MYSVRDFERINENEVQAFIRLDDERAIRVSFSHVRDDEAPPPLSTDSETVRKIVQLVKEMGLQIGDEIQTQGSRSTTKMLKRVSLSKSNYNLLFSVYNNFYPRGAFLLIHNKKIKIKSSD